VQSIVRILAPLILARILAGAGPRAHLGYVLVSSSNSNLQKPAHSGISIMMAPPPQSMGNFKFEA